MPSWRFDRLGVNADGQVMLTKIDLNTMVKRESEAINNGRDEDSLA
jgi:hypothetical protein